jgi:hypothetical protein
VEIAATFRFAWKGSRANGLRQVVSKSIAPTKNKANIRDRSKCDENVGHGISRLIAKLYLITQYGSRRALINTEILNPLLTVVIDLAVYSSINWLLIFITTNIGTMFVTFLAAWITIFSANVWSTEKIK